MVDCSDARIGLSTDDRPARGRHNGKMRWIVAIALACLCSLPASAGELAGRVVMVADGDTLTLASADGRDRVRVRLADIAAPKHGQRFATRSRQSLAELCAGKTAVLETADDGKPDREGGTIGRVRCGGIYVDAEQVRRGMAWVYVEQAPPTSALYALEADARLARRGLWRDRHAVAPWAWRRQKR
jgi:endonuclease YncB( thermonuclease family)